MREFAFDAKLVAVVRVVAASEQEAREKAVNVLDAYELNHDHDGVKIAEVSLDQSIDALPASHTDTLRLFEVDGVNQEDLQ